MGWIGWMDGLDPTQKSSPARAPSGAKNTLYKKNINENVSQMEPQFGNMKKFKENK